MVRSQHLMAPVALVEKAEFTLYKHGTRTIMGLINTAHKTLFGLLLFSVNLNAVWYKT